ncbi:PBP1A family penicillin-binding protein [soil metagenome]
MTYRQRKTRRTRGRGRAGSARTAALAAGVVVTVIAIGLLSVAGYVFAVAATAPDLAELKPADKGESSVIFAADGSRLGYVQSDVIRTPVPWDEMPEDVREAVIAIEDERFYEHEGVDYSAIVRAGIKNIESGSNVQGGSTITQQLVRALYIKDPERNFKRKIREAKLASELEQKRSKRWILEHYLNDVPFGTVGGRTSIGVEAASSTFFGKHVRELTLSESALLAGLPQAPSQYNPFRSPSAAIERRNDVLKKMVENRFITDAEASEASRSPLGLNKGTRYTRRREPYFFDYVQEQLIERYGVGTFRRGGLKVYTTIDPKVQDTARDAINSYYADPAGPSSSIVSIDPNNGKIKAMASSGTYSDRTFNIAAQGHRQPGSAFKTMVLTAAVREGVDPDSTYYTSMPLSINDPKYGPWNVSTFGDSYSGSMSLTQATLASDNTVYAQLILDVGPDKVCETAKLLGITTKLDCYPAEGLGGLTQGVTPLEMSSAYATLAAGGIRRRPTGIERVEFPDGKSEELGRPKGKRVITEGEAYEVTKILEQNVQSGTGTRANYGCPAAGKTGTTDEGKDAWFVGYTPKLSTSVWVGYPDAGIAIAGAQGGTLAAPVWNAFMSVANGEDCDGFPEPEEPAELAACADDDEEDGSSSYDSGSTYYPDPAPEPAPVPENPVPANPYADPELYEALPQDAPVPAPAPGGGGGGATPGQ